ncbi:MAG: NapC/NirT family cytochrome c [Candidatus Kryptoniota bacterium]
MSNRKFPDLFYNPISMVGAIIAAVTFGSVVLLMLSDMVWGAFPPYFGIVTYILLPSVLILGLVIIPIGALIERKRWRRAKETGNPPLPRIDLNDGKQRTAFMLFTTGTLLLMIFTAIGGYKAFDITESVSFCGKVCHTVMNPEYTTYLHSPHARVACVQCHVGPGASWYVKSKLSGAYQVYSVIFHKYPQPIPTPIRNLRPARETCEQCHWPQSFVGERRITKAYFLEDSANTRWTLDMLIKIGRSTSGEAQRSPVHWHVTHTVQYLPTDSASQSIPWVRVVDTDGKSEVFATDNNPFTPDSVKQSAVKTMDCMDCHNRPTHVIKTPEDAVNDAMASGEISPDIPWIKQTAVNALLPKYSDTKNALDSIAASVESFYKDKYPTMASAQRSEIKEAVASLQSIYQVNFFPYMRVDWRAYTNNIGHENYLGCFRCHDGNHKSAGGQIIPNKCETCHVIMSQGTKPQEQVSLAGVEFQHPTDIGDAWKQGLCTDCHDGTQ